MPAIVGIPKPLDTKRTDNLPAGKSCDRCRCDLKADEINRCRGCLSGRTIIDGALRKFPPL